ncbi:MAG TPA: hypothetical protein VGM63_17040 [Mucilaginibacter sp.]|jgi:energy-coupling factor transporter transmembrane protein EcfT
MNLTIPIIGLILLSIILVVVSFLISLKSKFITYILRSFSVLAMLIALIFISAAYYDKYESKYLIGIYVIDVKNSKFGNTDLSRFNSLILNINEDYTFSLSFQTPFFSKKNGTWVYHIDGDAEFIRCKFSDAKFAYQIIQRDSDLIFESNILKNGTSNDRIAFKNK